MTNGIPNAYTYNGNLYQRRSETEARVGFIAASVASALIMSALPPFSNPFLKQMRREHSNNHLYKDAFFRAVDNSGLKQKGLIIHDIRFSSPAEEALYKSGKQVANGDIKAGLNACFIPERRAIALNAEKATITGFHELGHAMNNLKGGFGRFIQKCRVPGYTIAGLMGTAALLSRPKPKEADRNIKDIILDNCEIIAFAGMLPTVAEESLASYKGIKLARTAGLSEELVKNLKKFYGKALLSYAGYAFLTGVSVFAASKITQVFTRPKKIDDVSPQFY